MNSWFSNSWLLRGLRRTPKAINTDDEEEYSYPREKQAKTVVKEETPFSGAMTSAAGSWVLCQDRAGQRYWWNEVTGQWTYQLYNNTQQNYMPHMMLNNLMYSQQQPYGMASSPQYMVQQPWLGSPSRESQGMHAGGAAAAWGWKQGGGYENEEDEEEEDEEEEEEEEEEDVKGVWGKYYTYRNGRRQSLWIHSATGIRTTVDPTA